MICGGCSSISSVPAELLAPFLRLAKWSNRRRMATGVAFEGFRVAGVSCGRASDAERVARKWRDAFRRYSGPHLSLMYRRLTCICQVSGVRVSMEGTREYAPHRAALETKVSSNRGKSESARSTPEPRQKAERKRSRQCPTWLELVP